MMNAEIGAVRAEGLGGDGKVDGLQECVGRRARRDCAEGVQWPNERKPIFFMRATLPGFPPRDDGSQDRGRRGVPLG